MLYGHYGILMWWQGILYLSPLAYWSDNLHRSLPPASLHSLRKSAQIHGHHLHLLELKQPRVVPHPRTHESKFIDHFKNDGHPLNIKQGPKATGREEVATRPGEEKLIHLYANESAADASCKFQHLSATEQNVL